MSVTYTHDKTQVYIRTHKFYCLLNSPQNYHSIYKNKENCSDYITDNNRKMLATGETITRINDFKKWMFLCDRFGPAIKTCSYRYHVFYWRSSDANRYPTACAHFIGYHCLPNNMLFVSNKTANSWNTFIAELILFQLFFPLLVSCSWVRCLNHLAAGTANEVCVVVSAEMP